MSVCAKVYMCLSFDYLAVIEALYFSCVASATHFFFIGVVIMPKEFGKHLREIREKNGYTQQQMADILNIGRSTYTYYETGKSQASYDKLKIMCEVFGVDYNTLLDF